MPLTNEQFLVALQESKLLPLEAIQTLRSLVAEAKGDVQPRHLAKWAVDHGHLTPFQAKEMLAGRWKADSRSSAAAEEDLLIVDDSLEVVDDDLEVVQEAPPPRRGKPARPAAPAPPPVDDELEVVEEAPAPRRKPARPAAPAPVDDELEVVEEPPAPRPAKRAPATEDQLEVVEDEDLMPPKGQPTFRGSPPRSAPRSRPPAPAAPTPAPAAPSPYVDMGRGPLDGALSQPGLSQPSAPGLAPQGSSALAAPIRSSVAQPKLQGAGKRRKDRGNIWDSTLLYWGGGTLLTLLIVGGVLLWRVLMISGDEMLSNAKGEYDRGNYSNAINQFELYVKQNPKHPFVSYARVHRGLAQMRQVVDSGSDWPRALEISERALAEISSEKEFPQAQGELAAMLPKVAVGLAAQAEKQRDRRLVDQANQAVALVNKFVPKTLRPAEQMQDVESSLVLTVRSLERSDRLAKTLAEIRQATEGGDTAKAYEARDALLATYPDLEADAGLQEAVLAASQSEQEQVKYLAAAAEAEPSEPASPLAGSMTLATTVGGPAVGAEGRIALALVEQAAYGLDAASGKVLWRRYVGGDTHFVPRASGASGDVLLVDSRYHDLVRVEAATGNVRWRRRIGEPLAGGPVILRDGLLVATRSGRVIRLDTETGASAGAIALPQKLAVSPAADVMRRKLNHIYQLGEHSNLYVLSADGTACDEVIYLGHERQAVAVPPVVMNRYLIIAENVGAGSGALRVLVTDEQGLGARQVQRINLDGHVHTPPIATSKELLVVTDRGALYSFEAGAPDKAPSLTQIAQKAGDTQESYARYLHVHGAQFWVAENQLTKYDVRAATGQLAPQWVKHIGEAFLQPPEHEGEFLYHVRRRPGLGGATVTCANLGDGLPVWETHLGAPLAGPPLLDPSAEEKDSLLALTSAGGLFQVAPSSVSGSQSAGAPLGTVQASGELAADTGLAQLAGGVVAFGGAKSADRVLVFDPQSSSVPLRWLPLSDALATGPSSLAGMLLTPGKLGQVALLDPGTGQAAVDPFQPTLSSDNPPSWVGLTPWGEKEAIISDGDAKLYRIGVEDQPRPHLAALAEVAVEPAIVSPIAVLDDMALGVDASGRVMAFRLPGLEQTVVQENGVDVKIGGEAAWGPAKVGDLVLLATSEDELLALDGKGNVAWTAALGRGKLVGAAALGKDRVVLALAEGLVRALDAGTGKESGQVEIGQPLASGLAVFGDTVVLAGHDGTLHVLPAKAIAQAATP